MEDKIIQQFETMTKGDQVSSILIKRLNEYQRESDNPCYPHDFIYLTAFFSFKLLNTVCKTTFNSMEELKRLHIKVLSELGEFYDV